jgi:hypothetical protein
MQTINLHHLSRALVLVAVPALLAAGCGGSSPSGGNRSAGQSPEDQQVQLVQCLRQHGVNASLQGGQVTIQPGPGGSPPDAQGQAARACAKYAPNGGQPHPPSAQWQDAMTKFAQCMRGHGIPVQDPQSGGGGGEITRNIDTNSSQFKQAMQACQHYMPGNPPAAGS